MNIAVSSRELDSYSDPCPRTQRVSVKKGHAIPHTRPRTIPIRIDLVDSGACVPMRLLAPLPERANQSGIPFQNGPLGVRHTRLNEDKDAVEAGLDEFPNSAFVTAAASERIRRDNAQIKFVHRPPYPRRFCSQGFNPLGEVVRSVHREPAIAVLRDALRRPLGHRPEKNRWPPGLHRLGPTPQGLKVHELAVKLG